MAGAISSILTTVQSNFDTEFFTPTAAIPRVDFYFGPEWVGQQSGPAQIIAFPGKEIAIGPETHYVSPGPQPRSLRQMWTRIIWMVWAPWAPLPNWTPETVTYEQLTIPTLLNQNGFYFNALTAGTTGSTEPVWPSVVGNTVLDGSVTWGCMGTTLSYSVTKTDNVEYIRAALVQAIHAAAVGSYKLIGGDWYTKSDQVAMAGVAYFLMTEWKIPLVDSIESMATITSIPVTSKLD